MVAVAMVIGWQFTHVAARCVGGGTPLTAEVLQDLLEDGLFTLEYTPKSLSPSPPIRIRMVGAFAPSCSTPVLNPPNHPPRLLRRSN
jgi:hypothetical protein